MISIQSICNDIPYYTCHMFTDSVYPDGDMLQFLQAGSLAVRLGDLLFIHGGTHENSVGWVPPSSPAAVSDPSDLGGYRTGDVDGWVEELEKFRSSEVNCLHECTNLCLKVMDM